MHLFRLYISGETVRSDGFRTEVEASLSEALGGNFDLQLVEVLANPELAGEDRVVVTPTLVKRAPPPVRKVFGDLSNSNRLRDGLGLNR